MLKGPKNMLSVDVEEWYQTILFDRTGYDDSRHTDLPDNVHSILSFLDACNTKATFFMVGTVVRKYPGLLKAIVSRGHEIACHGYSHKLVYKMSEQEFDADIRLSLDILKKELNLDIAGYRAPTWSVTKNTGWFIEILRSYGFKYDSSIYPVSINLFSTGNHKRFPYKIRDDFIESPPLTFRFLGVNIPFAGGTFLRFFPADFIVNRIRGMNMRGEQGIIYFHSWEFDERAKNYHIPAWKYNIQFCNVPGIKIKLVRIFNDLKFFPVREGLDLR